MKRREFLYTAGGATLAAGLGTRSALAFVPSHNWERHDFGPGPAVKERLYQGPFPQYPPEEVVPGSSVVMTTTPSSEIVPGYGMGLTAYISGDFWPPRTQGDSLEKYCEDLISLPFAQKVYVRVNWRDVQSRPGRLDFPEGWKVAFDAARRHGKRIGFRVMLERLPSLPSEGHGRAPEPPATDPASAGPAGLVVPAGDSARLEGFVVDAGTGEGLPGIEVELQGERGLASSVESDETGSFAFEGLPAGGYSLACAGAAPVQVQLGVGQLVPDLVLDLDSPSPVSAADPAPPPAR